MPYVRWNRAERDAKIRLLANLHPSWSPRRIAAEVGCHHSTVDEVLHPEKKAERNVARRIRARKRRGGGAER